MKIRDLCPECGAVYEVDVRPGIRMDSLPPHADCPARAGGWTWALGLGFVLLLIALAEKFFHPT